MKGTVIGVIGLGCKQRFGNFSGLELDLLDTLAGEVAITLESAHLYQELSRSKDLIRRAGRLSALGTLAAGIAHEIRNPLVSVQTFLQLAPERLHDREFIESFLQLTKEEVQRISNLVAELLTFARSPSHSIREIKVEEELERYVTLLSPEARKQRVRLELEVRGQIPQIYADPDQLKQVMANIVLNVIQATPPEGRVSIAACGLQLHGKSFCQLQVSDTSAGIPSEVREDIFNPFFTTKDRGTGLGLPIAQQIVSEHGGFITLDTAAKTGARSLIHFPSVSQGASVAGAVVA